MHRPTVEETNRAQLRFEAIRAAISGRLWPVNAGMSSATYNDLIDQMSLLQLNDESREVGGKAHVDTRLGPLDRRSGSAFAPRSRLRLLP